MTTLTSLHVATLLAMAVGFPAHADAGDGARIAAGGAPNGAFAFAAPDDDEPAHENARNTSLRDRALDAIKRRDFSEAEKLIHEGRKTRSSRRKDQWKLIESRLELERERYARAGLLAMEVVILREKSDEVAAALYWAGRAYEGLGRPSKAIQLYKECRDHDTVPDSLKAVVDRRIQELSKTEPKKP